MLLSKYINVILVKACGSSVDKSDRRCSQSGVYDLITDRLEPHLMNPLGETVCSEKDNTSIFAIILTNVSVKTYTIISVTLHRH